MTLFEVIEITRDLKFALCITTLDTGYYFPARACNKVHFIDKMLHREVLRFSIDFEEKVVFAHVGGCDE